MRGMLWLNIELDSCHSQPSVAGLSLSPSLSLFDTHSFPHIYLFALHLHFLSPNLSHFWSLFSSPFHLSFPQLFLAMTSFVNTDLCNNVWCCFRDAVSARGGGVSGPGNSDEEPVHRQWHAHSATRGRPCQQVSTSVPQRVTRLY